VRDDRLLLGDLLEAITRIERYAVEGRTRFDTDELVQTWIVHHLQIIGEAARKLSSEARKRAPDLPWPQIIAMRNILVHDYFGVDLETVWSTVENNLPVLKKRLEILLNELR
jgi:uncharacterized protein with HEPN domain